MLPMAVSPLEFLECPARSRITSQESFLREATQSSPPPLPFWGAAAVVVVLPATSSAHVRSVAVAASSAGVESAAATSTVISTVAVIALGLLSSTQCLVGVISLEYFRRSCIHCPRTFCGQCCFHMNLLYNVVVACIGVDLILFGTGLDE